MSEKSSAELEREAEAVRAQMSETADTLQRKLSPGQLVDEVTTYFKNSDGRVALDNLSAQVRDNPLPLVLVGAGLAWLFMGGGPSAASLKASRRGSFDRTDFGRYQGDYPEGHWEDDVVDRPIPADSMRRMGEGTVGGESDSGPSVTERMSSAYDSAKSTVSSAAEAITDSASQAAGSVSDSTSRAWRGMRRSPRYVGDSLSDVQSRGQRMIADTLDKEPLILGAIGLAVGAAIGAMMPRTRVEEEYLSPYAEKAGQSVREMAQQGMDEVRNVASKVYDEATEKLDSAKEEDTSTSSSTSASPTRSPSSLAATQPVSGVGTGASRDSASETNATVKGPTETDASEAFTETRSKPL